VAWRRTFCGSDVISSTDEKRSRLTRDEEVGDESSVGELLVGDEPDPKSSELSEHPVVIRRSKRDIAVREGNATRPRLCVDSHAAWHHTPARADISALTLAEAGTLD